MVSNQKDPFCYFFAPYLWLYTFYVCPTKWKMANRKWPKLADTIAKGMNIMLMK